MSTVDCRHRYLLFVYMYDHLSLVTCVCTYTDRQICIGVYTDT